MSTAANSQAPKGGEISESTGPVTSDSLAAESIKAGGAFAENDNAVASSVKGSNSTFNTTDTSGATVLAAAKDGTERVKDEAKGLGSDEKGVSGVKYPDADKPSFDGSHSQEGYVGGPSFPSDAGQQSTLSTSTGATGDSFADGSNTSSSAATGDKDPQIKSGSEATSGSGAGSQRLNITAPSSSADAAPNYTGIVSGAIRREGDDQPKGENLTEGNVPETKTFTGDVGGQHDPGRVAEQDFLKNAADSSAGEIKHAGSGGTENKFDVLSSERA